MSSSIHNLGSITIYEGDVRASLDLMPEQSVHTIVTSPPYWALRSYLTKDDPRKPLELGSEPTPDLFISNLVGVFAKVRRVLRDDGVVWVNLGDTYARDGGDGGPGESAIVGNTQSGEQTRNCKAPAGILAGSLCNIPHRFAEAMRADGWLWRSTVVWAKKSCMPESVQGWRWTKCVVKVESAARAELGTYSGETGGSSAKLQASKATRDLIATNFADCPGCAKCRDTGGLVLRRGSWRCTSSHEFIFQFAKTGEYFSDGEAAQERAEESTLRDLRTNADGQRRDRNYVGAPSNGGTNLGNDGTRNPRNVWTLSSEPSSLPHFAGFPREIPLRCLKSAPSKVCAACGAPHAPVVSRERVATRPGTAPKEGGAEANRDPERHVALSRVSGYRPTCECGADTGQAVVMDIFGGTGTTAEVAIATGRRAVLCELNEKYVTLIKQRIGASVPLFAVA